MSKTHPLVISCETHGLAGNLVLPDSASAESPVPGAFIVGGPGPVPMQRYSSEGMKQWPVQWTEGLADAGVAGLCYDQRGSGLSTGEYHDADWDALYADNVAVAEMLGAQPEVHRVAAVAWGDGCTIGLQLAAAGKVDALVLMAPAFHTAQERYARDIAALAARRGLSDRVVQIRIVQWKNDLENTAQRVEQGEKVATTRVGDQTVTTNLARFVQTMHFEPAEAVRKIKVPVLLLHGEDDTLIPPSESADMAKVLTGECDRLTYQGANHFIYRHSRVTADTASWLKHVLA